MGDVFATHEVTVEVSFEAAAAQMAKLLRQGALRCVCEGAYEGGLTAVLRVGPSGGRRALSKLVRVCFLEPARRGTTVTVPVRWVATGAAGELYPLLDGDLMLSRHGDEQVLLALTGSYRPPFGRAGDLLDKAVMHRLASATIRSVLDSLSEAITQPAPQFQPPCRPAPWLRPAPEHGQL